MRTIYTFLAAAMIGMVSCREDTFVPYEGDYLIFGHFYSECSGEACMETFKLEENRLLEDTQHRPGSSYNFERGYQVRSEADFALAQNLLTIFPDSLLAQPDSTFGCPDCYDQGGLYIEYKQGGKQGAWVIDQTQADVPDYLHEFTDQVNQTIRMLGE